MVAKLREIYFKLPPIIKNPFVIGLLLFAIWMLFVDDSNMLTQFNRQQELSALIEKRDYYILQIEKTNKEYAELESNPASQEKFAREHYRMKRDNEDVYVIVEEKEAP